MAYEYEGKKYWREDVDSPDCEGCAFCIPDQPCEVRFSEMSCFDGDEDQPEWFIFKELKPDKK